MSFYIASQHIRHQVLTMRNYLLALLEKSQNKREEDFLKQIGSLTVELNWAKKKLKEAGLGDQNGLD